MAYIEDRVDGKKIEEWLARLPEVQRKLDEVLFEARVRAETILAAHRADGHSFIETKSGRIDRYLILNDINGQKAAHILEYGRGEYEVERPDGTGSYRVKEWEGLRVLHRALGVRLGSLRGTGGGVLT